MRHPNLVKRSGIYYFRRRAPRDVIPQFGRPVVVKSLETRDYRVAVQRLRVIQGDTEREFETLRQAVALQVARKGKASRSGAFSLSRPEIEKLVHEYVQRAANALAAAPPASFPAERASELDDLQGFLSSPDPVHYEDHVGREAFAILRDAGLPISAYRGAIRTFAPGSAIPTVPIDPTTVSTITELLRPALIQLNRAERNKLAGAPSLPLSTVPSPAAGSCRTLDQLIKAFAADPGRGGRTQKTELDYGMVFRAMRETIGSSRPVTEITRDDCRAILSLFQSLPRDATKRFPKLTLKEAATAAPQERRLKVNTINSHITKLATVFNWAEREGWVSKSPARGLLLPNEGTLGEDGRRSWSPDELKTIFAAPLYRGCVDDERNFAKPGPNHPRRSRFWVPLIALFTGLRQSEACQLLVTDLETLDGIDVVWVRRTDGGQLLKTRAARRFVPLHPELIRIGLPGYARVLREQGQRELFPELRPDSRGYAGGLFQKRFNTFRRSLQLNDPDATFHSFRHTWRDALREARVPEEVAQVLGGWASAGQDKQYGSVRFSPQLRFQEISKIKYPVLDLSFLYTGG